jgi:hypothetical protein
MFLALLASKLCRSTAVTATKTTTFLAKHGWPAGFFTSATASMPIVGVNRDKLFERLGRVYSELH